MQCGNPPQPVTLIFNPILKGFETNSTYTVCNTPGACMYVCVFIDCQSLTSLHIEMIKIVR